MNWLRAAVLGVNDGIVSVACIVIGVAGATSARGPLAAHLDAELRIDPDDIPSPVQAAAARLTLTGCWVRAAESAAGQDRSHFPRFPGERLPGQA